MNRAGHTTPEAVSREHRHRPIWRTVAITAGVFLLLAAGAYLLTRYGVVTPQGRMVLEARTDGLKLGRLGRLKIEGLHGDVWRDFTVDHLTIRDEQGVWAEARDVHVVWRYGALLRRRFEAERIDAGQVTLVRRPVLTPKTESKGLPISFDIDQLRARVEMLPAFAQRRGVYDLAGSLQVGRRNSGQAGRLSIASRLHAGDRLDLRFGFGGQRPLRVEAQGVEAQGGALAGALGLPADQPFRVNLQAHGQGGAGQLTAEAATDGRPFLQAHGGWSETDIRIQGSADLAASSLTAPLAQRLGGALDLQVRGGPVRGGLRPIAAALRTPRATLRLAGRLRASPLAAGPEGLSVQLAVDPAAGLLPGQPLGRVALDATIKGDLRSWRLQGGLAVDRLEASGYRLDRIAGPVELAAQKGAIDVSARLNGAGGQGTGPLAALLGPTPSAELQGQKLKDGRLLLRRLEANGAGLRVTGRGGRDLFGRLAFSGEARLSNLEPLRPGATGVLTANWRARQANLESPWTLAAQVRGARLKTGFDELNRLLGPAPRMSLEGRFGRGPTVIERLRLDGAEASAAGSGRLGAGGALQAAFDWRARGPFGVGPVEIRGDARGAGSLGGRISAPVIALTARAETVDVPRLPLRDARLELRLEPAGAARSGHLLVTAASPYGPARASADLRLPPGGIQLSNLDLNAGGVTASGSVSVARGAPASADLQVSAGPGALLSAGRVRGGLRLQGSGEAVRAALDLTAANARPAGGALTIRSGRLRAEGPLSNLPYRLQAAGASPQGRWSLDGSGRLQTQGGAGLSTFEGEGALAGETLRTAEPLTVRFGKGGKTLRARLVTARGGRVSADANLSGDAAQLSATLSHLQLRLINRDLEGRFNATLALQGRGDRLTGALDARLTDARAIGSDPQLGLAAAVHARLQDRTLTATATASNPRGLTARADIELPTLASASPLHLAINQKGRMSGAFSAHGEIKPLWDLLVGGERSLSGVAHLDGRIGGSLAVPRVDGRATVQNGRFVDGATGLVLQRASLSAAFSADQVNVSQLTGYDPAGGELRGSGRLSLRPGGASSFQLRVKDFRIIDNELARAAASGEATVLRDSDGKISLKGRLTVERAEVSAAEFHPSGVVTMDVVEINKPADLDQTIAPPATSKLEVAMDVDIRAPRQVHVRGRGLDLELAVNAHVGGTTAEPVLRGTARVVRGDYEFAGKRFVFDETGVVQLSTAPERIRLDLTARREDATLTAVIHVGGTAAKPEITLSSAPSLPQDEILAQVLFGRSASQLSGLEAARLAAAVSSLAGGGGFDLLGNLRSIAGLDRLAFLGGASGLTVQGGKYLSDDVYLEIIGGGRDGPAVQVEWRVRRNLSVFSRLTGRGGADLAVRWRRAY